MTLKNVKLKSNYISLRDDVAEQFYIPVMSNCIRFDRVSCYFTFDAIARYCTGIYHLGKNNGKFRLLISQNVSKETFEAIREGYQGYQMLDDMVREKMRQELSLEDKLTLSNLSYLIKCGLVEIKFAFCRDGLFHEKTGYAEDSEGNSLCFIGSNNETKEAFENNYEKFEVTASWLSSEFDSEKIVSTRDEFVSMWGGTNLHVRVMDPPESFDSYMQTFNRGSLFKDADDFITGSFYIDYTDDRVSLRLPDSIENPGRYKYNLAIQSMVEKVVDHTLVLRPGLTNHNVRTLMEKVRKKAEQDGYEVAKSNGFLRYISSHTSLEQLALLGMSIKQRDPGHKEYFELFKREVCSLTENDLREEQLWDSYFAFRLKKSANFSVPGSGKTATALGMFAYLNRTVGVNRLIVVGPLNSFDSWTSEFKRVFGSNLPMASVTSSELRETGNTIQYNVRFNLGKYNLVLLNYESFDHNAELTDAVQKRIDDRTMLVFDEVHRIKAINGKRASGVMPIAKNSKYTIVMTGTPIPNDYSDVYNFLHILYDSDYDDYFVYGPHELAELEGEDVPPFNRKLQPFYCRTTKSKLNVPPPNRDHIVRVAATEEENILFRQLHQLKISAFALIIRVLQLESNPAMLNETLLTAMELSSFFDDMENDRLDEFQTVEGARELKTAKTAACVDLVKELTDSGKPVIIWCIFIKTISTLSRLLKDEGISVCEVHGGTEDRQQIIDDYKAGRYQVLITNPQTLAESVSLHKVCHDAVYFEYSYNLIHLLQSKDRIHRLGLAGNQYTQYHFLETVFDGDTEMVSLDEEIHNRLNHKEQVMLEAIENDSLEHFTTTKKEIEDILWSIGFDKEMFK
ncbi:MAG: SNF2-related protein [Methanomassiliicoccales archaeon]|nr:SNF2-related protein [Methanomassiliicoccales archaeon]MDD7479090.1 SNF2-related protein [Methanomassiliicoccales archaeon]